MTKAGLQDGQNFLQGEVDQKCKYRKQKELGKQHFKHENS